MAEAMSSGLLHLYGSIYSEKPRWIYSFFCAQLTVSEPCVRLEGFQHAVLHTHLTPDRTARGPESQGEPEHVPLKLDRSTFPKCEAICLIIYLFYLCFRTSPDNCLTSS